MNATTFEPKYFHIWTYFSSLVAVLVIFTLLNWAISEIYVGKFEKLISDSSFVQLGDMDEKELIDLNMKISILLACGRGGTIVLEGTPEVDRLVDEMWKEGLMDLDVISENESPMVGD